MAVKPSTLWNVTRTVYAHRGFSEGLILFTIGAFFHSLFFTLTPETTALRLIMLLFMTQFALIILLEIPTGAIGDALGRKKTVTWSIALQALFFLALGLMTRMDHLAALLAFGIGAKAFIALSETFFSGTFDAWIVDESLHEDADRGFDRLISQGYVYYNAAMILGVAVGILLYENGYPLVVFAIGILSCIFTLIYCRSTMQENTAPRKNLSQQNYLSWISGRIREIISVSTSVCFKSGPILVIMLLFSAFCLLLNLIDYLWPVAFEQQFDIPQKGIRWVVLAVALIAIATLGSRLLTYGSDRYSRIHGTSMPRQSLRRWLLTASLLGAVPILGLALYYRAYGFSFWLFSGALFLGAFGYGIAAPAYRSLLNLYIPKEHSSERATIMSIGSIGRSILILALALPSSGKTGATTISGWVVPTSILLVTTALAYVVLRRAERST